MMGKPEKPYGFELILDLHGCDVSKFNRKSIEGYMVAVCEAIGMVREDLHFWDYEGMPEEEIPKDSHLLGTSAVQFISTSNIVIHTLNLSVFSTSLRAKSKIDVGCAKEISSNPTKTPNSQ